MEVCICVSHSTSYLYETSEWRLDTGDALNEAQSLHASLMHTSFELFDLVLCLSRKIYLNKFLIAFDFRFINYRMSNIKASEVLNSRWTSV